MRSRIVSNALKSVDADKNLGTFINHEAILLQINFLPCDKLLPLVEILLLRILMYPVDICVNISIEGEGILIILEYEWERLYLVRQTNVHLLIAALSQLFDEVFKPVIRLVLHARGYLDEYSFEFDFVDDFGVVGDCIRADPLK